MNREGVYREPTAACPPKGSFPDERRSSKKRGLARHKNQPQNERMSQTPIDLDYVNDNLPIEYQIGVILRWAEQCGFPNVAATLQRTLDELEKRKRIEGR